MRWSERRKSDYARSVETVSIIEEMLGSLYGLIQLETGSHNVKDGETRVDYVLHVTDYEDARRVSRELQYRRISSGVRPESNRYVLRISKNDLISAFVSPAEYSYEGISARELLEERFMTQRRMNADLPAFELIENSLVAS